MSDIALTSKNANNGRFELAWDSSGDVVFDDTEEHAVMSCLVDHRGKWFADTEGTHGSDLYLLNKVTPSLASSVEAAARQALKPLVDAKRITIEQVIVEVSATRTIARYTVNVYWSSRGASNKVTRISV